MDIFGKLFGLASTRSDGVITNADINKLAEQHQQTGITVEGEPSSDSTFVQPITPTTEFFQCWSCKCTLQIRSNQQYAICGFCENKNEIYRVQDTSKAIDTWQVKGKPVQHQQGRTTDDDDIIDISYQEVPPTPPAAPPGGEYHVC